MNILFQNRANAYEKPGGDTIVMNNLSNQLKLLGHSVQFSSNATDTLTDIDIIHIFNLTLQSVTDAFSQNAKLQNKPFVTTPLQENFPLYYNMALSTIMVFRKYIEKEQPKDFFDKAMELIYTTPPMQIITAPYTLKYANMHFTCSNTETDFIKSFSPSANTKVIQFGSNIKDIEISPEIFENKFGVKDFVLCVGRLEARKNQLMLLKALENEDIPIVFADGGFTYTDDYKQLCQSYKRKGKTIFTGRLSDEMLVSAYKAAGVHCLPSWYELPGLVTLEAAKYGCPVIASSWGAIYDYMGNTCTYCQPDDYQSIHSAIITVFQNKKDDSAKIKAEEFTWKKTGEKTLTEYKKIIS